MTRKELAVEIAKGQIKKLSLRNITVESFALALLNGRYGMKATKKDELVRWYNNLCADGYIA